MRLVTRGDLDGLTCSVLITSVERIDAIELVHPQQLTDGRFEVRDGDVLANLPYHPCCSMWFDHHELVESNLKPSAAFQGRYGIAPSTARLVHDFYAEKRGWGVFERYGELSHRVFEIYRRYTPLVEPLSLDEAFLDVTGSRALFGDGGAIARAIKQAVRAETGLTVSAGVADVKFAAKIASDLGKPDGLVEVPPGGVAWSAFSEARSALSVA